MEKEEISNLDKKSIFTRIILISKVYILLFCFTIPFNILVSILGFISDSKGESIIDLIISNLLTSIFAFLFLGILIYSILGFIYLFSVIKRKRDIILTDTYTRDLPEYFPPAIASLLLDLSIENTTDYTATIAYLISNKYIKLKEDNNEVEVLSTNKPFKSKHEKYAFECVTKQRLFSQSEFKKLIVEDAKEMNLVKDGKRSTHFFRNFFTSLLLASIFSVLSNISTNEILVTIFNILGLISGVSMFGVIGFTLYLLSKYQNESIQRTKKGEIAAKKFAGLKRYLKNYTLISNKNLEDIVLFENYIPYAISLNEAKSVEKFILNNDNYRALIYGENEYNNFTHVNS